jgi:hypothetical protein
MTDLWVGVIPLNLDFFMHCTSETLLLYSENSLLSSAPFSRCDNPMAAVKKPTRKELKIARMALRLVRAFDDEAWEYPPGEDSDPVAFAKRVSLALDVVRVDYGVGDETEDWFEITHDLIKTLGEELS